MLNILNILSINHHCLFVINSTLTNDNDYNIFNMFNILKMLNMYS